MFLKFHDQNMQIYKFKSCYFQYEIQYFQFDIQFPENDETMILIQYFLNLFTTKNAIPNYLQYFQLIVVIRNTFFKVSVIID